MTASASVSGGAVAQPGVPDSGVHQRQEQEVGVTPPTCWFDFLLQVHTLSLCSPDRRNKQATESQEGDGRAVSSHDADNLEEVKKLKKKDQAAFIKGGSLPESKLPESHFVPDLIFSFHDASFI